VSPEIARSGWLGAGEQAARQDAVGRDPDAELGFGYVMNLWSYQAGERRARNLTDAVRACLG